MSGTNTPSGTGRGVAVGVSVGVAVGVGSGVSVGDGSVVSVGEGDGLSAGVGDGVSVAASCVTPNVRVPVSPWNPPACIQYVFPLLAVKLKLGRENVRRVIVTLDQQKVCHVGPA